MTRHGPWTFFSMTMALVSCSGPLETERAEDESSSVEFVRLRRDAAAPAMHREPPQRSLAVGAFAAEAEDGSWSDGEISPFDRERYDAIAENRFENPLFEPLSTFSIDVDTASYSNVRRLLVDGERPPSGAVRIEELINYFDYAYEAPTGDRPFSVTTELAKAPWSPEHRLLRVGLQAAVLPARDVPPCNLVFLIDVSGSMQDVDKLPLVKRGLRGLARRLRPEDHVAIVVYAGASGLALPPTAGSDPTRILGALARLEAGGSTNGGDGIRLAYTVARRRFDPEGTNRVILATDGDFNVGVTSRSELLDLIEREREDGIFLTVLGVGTGNLNDAGMEALADRGNGNYAYLDSAAEARKVLEEEAGGTLVTVAKDVKIQIEFNPRHVAAYRLIGYENRRLEARDFDDDRIDAGEIGAGHSVTALYEIVPPGREEDVDAGSEPLLRYQRGARETFGNRDELARVRLRYKEPLETESRLLEHVVPASPLAEASGDLRFASSVALFGMLLRDSPHAGEGDWAMVQQLAEEGRGGDPRGLREGFAALAVRAAALREEQVERWTLRAVD